MADAQVQARLRKVAPIYDALDAGNYRQALKLCEHRQLSKMVLVMVRVAFHRAHTTRHWRHDALRVCLLVWAGVEGCVFGAYGASSRSHSAVQPSTGASPCTHATRFCALLACWDTARPRYGVLRHNFRFGTWLTPRQLSRSFVPTIFR